MAQTVKRRIELGDNVIEQQVYNVPDGSNIRAYDPEKNLRERFRDSDERKAFNLGISRRQHYRNFMANFSPSSLYSTLTFDDAHEVHTFQDAKRIRNNIRRVFQKAFPNAVFFIYMGRGKTTARIHFHMVSEGLPKEVIEKKWKYGMVTRCVNLRKHNRYNGKDHGADYMGLATYLFNHWIPEIGGHHWFQTKNARKPEVEQPKPVRIRGGYSEKRPPRAPKGYTLVEAHGTKYGYCYFRYVRLEPERKKRGLPFTSGGHLLS